MATITTLKRYTAELMLVLTTILLIAALFLIWHFFATLWLRIPAMIAAPLLLLVVLVICPLLKSLSNKGNHLSYVWKGCCGAMVAAMLYLVWPSVLGIIGCVALMAAIYYLGIVSFVIACLGGFEELAEDL